MEMLSNACFEILSMDSVVRNELQKSCATKKFPTNGLGSIEYVNVSMSTQLHLPPTTALFSNGGAEAGSTPGRWLWYSGEKSVTYLAPTRQAPMQGMDRDARFGTPKGAEEVVVLLEVSHLYPTRFWQPHCVLHCLSRLPFCQAGIGCGLHVALAARRWRRVERCH